MSPEKITLEPHRLILLTGSVAVGKTRLALGISEVIQCTFLDKDTIADGYTLFRGKEYMEVRDLIYKELEQRVRIAVSRGETTVVEVTLGDKRERSWEKPYREIALVHGAKFVPIHVVATEELMINRIIERGYSRDLIRLAPEEWARLMLNNPREINTLPADGLRLENNGDFARTLNQALAFITS